MCSAPNDSIGTGASRAAERPEALLFTIQRRQGEIVKTPTQFQTNAHVNEPVILINIFTVPVNSQSAFGGVDRQRTDNGAAARHDPRKVMPLAGK
jgi:hypothetical protein